MATNELYLDSADIRNNIVSLAKMIGYTPSSPRAPMASIDVTLNNATGTSVTMNKGTVFTTNRRVWEFDNKFKNYLKKVRAYSIDMETATLFTVGFHNRIPIGALLLVTDQPMIPDGIKTQANDDVNSALFDKKHLKLGVESLKQIINNEDTVRHLKF